MCIKMFNIRAGNVEKNVFVEEFSLEYLKQ